MEVYEQPPAVVEVKDSVQEKGNDDKRLHLVRDGGPKSPGVQSSVGKVSTSFLVIFTRELLGLGNEYQMEFLS